ncbi:hypothetical protein [Streptacidiphilus monticola]|uniref:DUF998 domain-containing protein n=1 Tax=Streptacidiphilus monticola TaxID=2161674 RepID=A0ABW1G9B5_9ACTN
MDGDGSAGGGPARAVQGGQDTRTVALLRLGVGTIGVALPVVVPLGNWLYAELRGRSTAGFWPASISGSYYTSTRNVFVGSLCALGVFLLCYRASRRDDRWSTVAGLFAVVVALCPTAPVHASALQQTVGVIHLVSAGVLLSALALFCLASFRDAAASRRADRGYLAAGVLILVFLAVALVTGVTHVGDGWAVTPLYVCESLSVWAFGGAWLAAAVQASGQERAPGGAALPGPTASPETDRQVGVGPADTGEQAGLPGS